MHPKKMDTSTLRMNIAKESRVVSLMLIICSHWVVFLRYIKDVVDDIEVQIIW